MPTPKRPKRERFCICRREIISRGRKALLNALNITFLWSSVTELRCSKISENSKIVTGLTLPTPERPKLARFCIRRREVINRGRTALQNALNSTFLGSRVTYYYLLLFSKISKSLGSISMEKMKNFKNDQRALKRVKNRCEFRL